MSVKYHNFGGVIGWNLQKYFPNLSSDSYLKLQRSTRNKLQQEYIDYFLSTDEPPMPLVVNLKPSIAATAPVPSVLQTKMRKSAHTSVWRILYFTVLLTSLLTGDTPAT